MTLNQLRYFCTAARCHSITQAAKLMFVTQPAVSSAIRELETEFSVKLLSLTKLTRSPITTSVRTLSPCS